MFVDHARFLPRKIQIKFFSQVLQQIPVDNFSNFFCDSFFMVVITLPSPHYNCLKNLFFLISAWLLVTFRGACPITRFFFMFEIFAILD